jgi:hypothetical protein
MEQFLMSTRRHGIPVNFDVINKSTTPCEICGGFDSTRSFGAWLTGTKIAMCYHCFDIWYDGGETATAEIRVRSLKNQGRHPETMENFDPAI